MGTTEGPLTFSQLYSLKECVDKCKHIDDAREILSKNPGYTDCFEFCNSIVLRIAQCYDITEGTVCHALMVVQTFISTKGPEEHQEFSQPMQFELFWSFVSMVCYTLSVNFIEMKFPVLEHLMQISFIPTLPRAKKIYKRVQMHVLSSIKWKLHFPTGKQCF
jgi:hypothetical protein